jgi:hypothetical protein
MLGHGLFDVAIAGEPKQPQCDGTVAAQPDVQNVP